MLSFLLLGKSNLFSFNYLIERYYVDGLHLPVINGANEGIVMVIFMFVISGIFGNLLTIL